MRAKVPFMIGFVLALVGTLAFAQPADNGKSRAPEGEGCIVDSNLGPDGEWRCFDWGAGEPATVSQIFLTGPYQVEVTDCFCAGDVFELFVDGVSIGSTTAVAVDEDCTPSVSGFDSCFADPAYSKGTFYLGPGTHQITIEASQNFFQGGGAAIRAFGQPTQAIPTLGAWGLGALVVLLAGASFLLLRRRRAA